MLTNGLTKTTAVPIWDPGRLREAAQKMGGEPPVWVQVFPYPSYVCTIDGQKTTLVTDDASQASIVEMFEEKGNDLFIDYEHATVTEGVFYAPAAGRIVEVVAGGKLGLLARCEWTDEAAEDIREGRYYYDSPAFWWAEDDKRVYILAGLALTNYPGSFSRPYITDHNATNYETLLKKGAARTAGVLGADRPLKLKCAKEGALMSKKDLKQGNQKLTDSVMNSMRYAFDLPMTTTGNELRAFLTALTDAIEANDSPIFIIEDDQKALVAGAKTIGEALALIAQKNAPAPAAPIDLKPLRVALEVDDEKADVNALTLRVLTMKASSVPASRVAELEKQLAESKVQTDAERIDLLISSNKAAKSITPAREKEARRLAAQSFDLAKAYVEAIPPLDLSSQSAGTQPSPKTEAAVEHVSPNPVIAESQKRAARLAEIMTTQKVSRSDAREILRQEEAAARQ